MAIRVGINGFGRIGRCVVRAIHERRETGLEVVAINDLTSAETLAHLLEFDSVHGRFSEHVSGEANTLRIGKQSVAVSAERDPAALAWKKHGVDLVLECTGLFTKREKAAKHLEAGARSVLISAPAADADLSIVFGVNHRQIDAKKHQIISNASCTTNCLAPMARVLLDSFGLKRGLVTTIHSYTNDQRILDLPHSDLRRARAAALSMIPTTTGAAKAVALVIPELEGKLDGVAVRVPTPNVSLVDLTAELGADVTVAEVNSAFRAAASAGDLKGILAYTEEPLVSVDYNHSRVSCTLDGPLTRVMSKTQVKVFGWYDNEWGFSNRMVDVALHLASQLS